MRTERRPPSWHALDAEVEAAAERVRDLHRRSLQASATARVASERVAEVEAADRRRRSAALADGANADPGADAKAIAKAEREAEQASEAASVLADACSEAQARLDAVIAGRSEPWEAAARQALDEASAELRGAVDALADAYAAWRCARGQLNLTLSERSRRKNGDGIDATLPELRKRSGEAMSASEVIAALGNLTADPAEPPEIEREPLNTDERRELVRAGVEVHGPGFG